MNDEILKFFRLQRQIFGICPNSGQFFRLSDCKIYVKGRTAADWMDDLCAQELKLYEYEEKTKEDKAQLLAVAKKKGRLEAARIIRKADPLFSQKKLDPDDAKAIFHPVDYLIFHGMKSAAVISKLLFLDQETKSKKQRRLQGSIEKAVEKEKYDWVTLRIEDDGGVVEE